MPLSEAEVDAHILRWEDRLSKGDYPHRQNWPSRLFHHSPIENAVRILNEGYIRARRDPANHLPRDVAGRGVINLRHEAHSFVRFYFRPKTPTQFHIEGIRKEAECEEFGVHAPILIMFVFKAKPILTSAGTQFSDENMQKGSALTGNDIDFFNTIPFEKVYHEGGLRGDRTIIGYRCAEVLAQTPIPLEGNLQWIYCRSEAERDTLLYKLGPIAAQWKDRIRVSDDIKVFHRLFCYVEHVNLSEKGIVFELHPRHDGQKVALEIDIFDGDGSQITRFRDTNFSPYPRNGKRWYTEADLVAGTNYRSVIRLEGHEAFEAILNYGDALL